MKPIIVATWTRVEMLEQKHQYSHRLTLDSEGTLTHHGPAGERRCSGGNAFTLAKAQEFAEQSGFTSEEESTK